MAIWQVPIKLIPRKNFINSSEYDAKENFFAWEDKKKIEKSLMNIAAILKTKKSWSKNIILYGDEESNCVELFYNRRKLEEVSIRLDLRDIPKKLLGLIIEIAKKNDALIWIQEEETAIEPEWALFTEKIRKSSAAKFSQNPQEFLANISSHSSGFNKPVP